MYDRLCDICGRQMKLHEGYGDDLGECGHCGTVYGHNEGPGPEVPAELKAAIGEAGNATEYRPRSLVVDCGDMRIDVTETARGTVTIDSKPLTNVRAIDVHIRRGDAVTVTVERLPEARSDET